METNNIDLTWPCFTILGLGALSVMGFLAWVRYQQGLQYQERFRAARERGAFDDMNAPAYQRRFRWLAIIALTGLYGMVAAIPITIAVQYGGIRIPVGFIFGGLAFFGILSSIAGFLMKREIDRRL